MTGGVNIIRKVGIWFVLAFCTSSVALADLNGFSANKAEQPIVSKIGLTNRNLVIDGSGMPLAIDGSGVPLAIDGSGIPLAIDGSGVPLAIDGSGMPLAIDGSGVPLAIDGSGMPLAIDGSGVPLAIDGSGMPLALDGSGVPLAIDGSGIPLAIDGSGVPLAIDGSGMPLAIDGSGVPLAIDELASFFAQDKLGAAVFAGGVKLLSQGRIESINKREFEVTVLGQTFKIGPYAIQQISAYPPESNWIFVGKITEVDHYSVSAIVVMKQPYVMGDDYVRLFGRISSVDSMLGRFSIGKQVVTYAQLLARRPLFEPTTGAMVYVIGTQPNQGGAILAQAVLIE